MYASELSNFSNFHILKLLFLPIFCWYFRYFAGTNDMLSAYNHVHVCHNMCDFFFIRAKNNWKTVLSGCAALHKSYIQHETNRTNYLNAVWVFSNGRRTIKPRLWCYTIAVASLKENRRAVEEADGEGKLSGVIVHVVVELHFAQSASRTNFWCGEGMDSSCAVQVVTGSL